MSERDFFNTEAKNGTLTGAVTENPAAAVRALGPLQTILIGCGTKMMTFDETERLAKNCGIDLSHECDEDAAECNCSSEQLAEDGLEGKHAPGDSRCANRAHHTACSHDIERLSHAMGANTLGDED